MKLQIGEKVRLEKLRLSTSADARRWKKEGTREFQNPGKNKMKKSGFNI